MQNPHKPYGVLTTEEKYSQVDDVNHHHDLTHWGRDEMDAISQTTFS